MEKKYLFSPGPTMLPPEVVLKMAEPIMHHREPEFEKVFAEVREGLKSLFQTKNEVLVFTSSETGAMEASVSNLLSKGDKALVVRAGKFGERWGEICKAYGVEFIPIDVEWGRAVDPRRIQEVLTSEPSIRAVYTQATETSTGVVHPIREIGEVLRRYHETLLVVDAITGIGVFDMPMDKWGLDVVISGSQKALMLPPGLAFAALSEKAWTFVERSNLPKYYFDFKREMKAIQKNQSAYTPAISLLVGLRESLRLIRQEGLAQVFRRHETLARATRAAVKALGLDLFAPERPSPALTAVKVPEGIDGLKLQDLFFEKFGITVAEGQDRAKGKIIRIAHLGYYDRLDMVMVISALEMLLREMGYRFELGKGVKAAEEVFLG